MLDPDEFMSEVVRKVARRTRESLNKAEATEKA